MAAVKAINCVLFTLQPHENKISNYLCSRVQHVNIHCLHQLGLCRLRCTRKCAL